ncbi:hypothetical protein F5Y16DRAFT_88409 [Xylariaceae sp. FL0255]|nr:hypothetical protein F5Y16DRAFT_88409 [Xylariaceae sp. FL0255]
MVARHLAFAASLLGLSSGYTISPASTNGFPNPNQQQLQTISKQAGGLLSNAQPPATLSAAGVTNFQLIAFNENFEVAFFDSLIHNITNKVPGFAYESDHRSEAEIVEILKTVLAQEELHALAAANVLNHFKAFSPSPCTYKFPTTNLSDAIQLAETFTSLVLGTLQDAQESLASNGDFGPVRTVSSVIGQEGEQNGLYRFILDREPSAQPFLTTSVGPYAFSALQDFIVTCPFDVTQIGLPIFGALNVLTTAEPKDMYLSFSADISDFPQYSANSDWTKLFVTYLSGQLVPISEPITNAKYSSGVLTFDALFPYTENIMEGLTIAGLTNSSNFATPDDMVAATLSAPGLIEVNDCISDYAN